MNNLLPYAFARDYGVLARSNGDPAQAVEVLVSNATKPAAIAEVSRRFGRIALRRMASGCASTPTHSARHIQCCETAKPAPRSQSDFAALCLSECCLTRIPSGVWRSLWNPDGPLAGRSE